MRRTASGSFVLTWVALLAMALGIVSPTTARHDVASPVATPIESGGSDWPMYRGKPERSGNMSGSGINGQPVELWRVQASGPVVGAPAVAGGVVYAASGDGFVFALDAASGAQRWRST